MLSDEAIPAPQELLPYTLIAPDTDEVPKSTVIEFVELLPVTPAGKVHV
jgi:hypothetical protein